MVPITRRDEANDPMEAPVENAPRREPRYEDGNRQPQMSGPGSRNGEQGVEPDHWLGPDTRGDIVVSRCSGY